MQAHMSFVDLAWLIALKSYDFILKVRIIVINKPNIDCLSMGDKKNINLYRPLRLSQYFSQLG